MMDLKILFVCLMLFMSIQAVGTYIQVKQYKRAVRRLHKKGNIGIGSKRSRIRNNIVIIACNNKGTIVDGEVMEGITVFTKFKEIKNIVGKNIFELQKEYEHMSKKEQKIYKGHIQAIEALCHRLESTAINY